MVKTGHWICVREGGAAADDAQVRISAKPGLRAKARKYGASAAFDAGIRLRQYLMLPRLFAFPVLSRLSPAAADCPPGTDWTACFPPERISSSPANIILCISV